VVSSRILFPSVPTKALLKTHEFFAHTKPLQTGTPLKYACVWSAGRRHPLLVFIWITKETSAVDVCITGNGRDTIGASLYTRVQPQTDMETQIHQLEQEAYCWVLRAFKVQSDAKTWVCTLFISIWMKQWELLKLLSLYLFCSQGLKLCQAD
jgi:hypothetical protein